MIFMNELLTFLKLEGNFSKIGHKCLLKLPGQVNDSNSKTFFPKVN